MKKIRIMLVASVLAVFLGPSGETRAMDKIVIPLKITQDGLVSSQMPIVNKRLTLPKGIRVKLVFEYQDSNKNSHRFNLVSNKTDMTTRTIAPDTSGTVSLEFTVGERGEEFYRLSCELPCVAMEALTDYLIMVGPPVVRS